MKQIQDHVKRTWALYVMFITWMVVLWIYDDVKVAVTWMALTQVITMGGIYHMNRKK